MSPLRAAERRDALTDDTPLGAARGTLVALLACGLFWYLVFLAVA